MVTKLQLYSELSEKSTLELTKSRENWTNYLTTAARLYKYPFDEQIMIFAQRPDATACATLEIWNKPMNRYVQRGSKGIALIDRNGYKPKLKYVFDFADTEKGLYNSKNPHIWAFREEHETSVIDMLSKKFGNSNDSISNTIYSIANDLAMEYYKDNARNISYAIEDSFLEELDEFNVQTMFCMALTMSASYSIMSRCGLDANEFFEDEDFQCLFDFNTTRIISELGVAVSKLAEQVLREIEVTIKKYELLKIAERSENDGQLNLQQERGILDTRHSIAGTIGGNPGEIRNDEEALFAKTQRGNVQPYGDDRKIISTSSGDRPNSEQTPGANDERVRTEEPTTGQEYGSDGMGGAYERTESTGRGIYSERTNIQLNAETSPFAQVEVAHEAVAKNGSQVGNHFLFDQSLIPLNVVDTFLRDSGNKYNSILRISAFYMKQKSAGENIEFLMNEFEKGGKGIVIDNQHYAIWFDEQGVFIGEGPEAVNALRNINLTWANVDARISELLGLGQYVDKETFSLAIDNEYKEISERLWYFYRDVLEGLPAEWKTEAGGFPVETKFIKTLLEDPTKSEEIVTNLQVNVEYINSESSSIRTRSKTNALLNDLKNCLTKPHEFEVTAIDHVDFSRFITEDEVKTFFTKGSGVNKDKFRVFSYFLQDYSTKEKISFLKEEYGTGGSSHALSGADDSNEDHGGKGISLSRYRNSAQVKVELTWSNAVSYIDKLIGAGRYMSRDELNYIPEYEKTIIAREVKDFFRSLPLEHERPDFIMEEYDYAKEDTLRELLDVPSIVAELSDSMGKIHHEIYKDMDNSEQLDDRHFQWRKTACDNINAYKNGDFALFPNLSAVPQPENSDHYVPPIFYVNENIPEQLTIFPTIIEQQQIIADSFKNEESASDLEISVEDSEYAPKINDEIIGETIYLENDRKFAVSLLIDDEIELVDNELEIPIKRFVKAADFEKLVRGNPLNSSFFAEKEDNHVEAKLEIVPIKQVPFNFHITNDGLGIGSSKIKAANNSQAIRKLKQIEAENRLATAEEQEILSRYVGWGGIQEIFDAKSTSWIDGYNELKNQLTPVEYDSARASTLNAHYTPPVVIKAIYKAIESMGFEKGNILEPACGVGTFFGLLPENMQNSKLHGIELDSISARISKVLYPKASIKEMGFENAEITDNTFDLVIGNVPFGDYSLNDQRYNNHKFMIHDYFFAKSIDKVSPGGMLALISTSGTMDKRNSKPRKYIAERCDLIGAIRLPNNAFENAGADVTTDIIFLQKRHSPRDINFDTPNWIDVEVIHKSEYEDTRGNMQSNVVTVNSYFRDNPEMVLGNLEVISGPFGPKLTCKPKDEGLAEQLNIAISYLDGQFVKAEIDETTATVDKSIEADSSVKNFSFALYPPNAQKPEVEELYYRENSRMHPVSLPMITKERIIGMIGLSKCVRMLIQAQLETHDDYDISTQQTELNKLYDAFTAKHGLINSSANSKAFSSDSAYYLLCSLEVLDENGKLERKADMFSKRTIMQKTIITSVDTSSEALAVSLSEHARVDMDFMRQLTGFSDEKLLDDLQGVIFRVPIPYKTNEEPDNQPYYQNADEYLSGNVREKLKIAISASEASEEFKVNVQALESVQPKGLTAAEINVRLGATWIEPKYIKQFVQDLLKPSYYISNSLEVSYLKYTGEWSIRKNGRISSNDVLANVSYGTKRINAYEIIADCLNLRDVRIYDTKIVDDKEKRVLNKNETTKAQQKQQAIKEAFKEWIWKDPQRRETLVTLYNERFNSIRPREYDGSHLTFSGISLDPSTKLRSHQVNADARILYGGNALLAHVVGAGKTFVMVAAAMEGKRLGLCHKSLFCVPNHLTEQTASEFLRLYPSANILVSSKKDFETKNRKKFCSKIATGDYDAVIIGHSQLEKIPVSKERQQRFINEEIGEITAAIDEISNSREERFTIKQLERTKKSLNTKLEKLNDDTKKDDVLTFEQLGVDRLFVDEAHNFKNLFLYTKMRNVAGLSQSEAQKSSDLFLKCRYIDEITDGKGIIFATGTPISNSMTELYTMQRYLQFNYLQANNLYHFDSWASIFGETATSIELAPEGNGYRARTRFAKFHNLPELMNAFKEVADIQTADMLDLPRPIAKFDTIVVEPSDIQVEMVKKLSERAVAVHDKKVAPEVDNMLKITSDGRKIGLDQRLVDSMLPDNPKSKVNSCMENIFNIWRDTQADKLTQLCFCDFSTPNKDGRFNVYDDIREKLIEKGIPESEIAFIHHANSDMQKKELFAKVRQGTVRILLGSTFKMGSGTNVQDRLIALHDLDCPWRPSDLEQRAGRIVRQGNMNSEVYVYRYVTEGTFDAYLYQTIENKQKFISQIMTSKSPMRSCEDVDESVLSYAEIKALCAGNPLIKEKMDLDIEVARLRIIKSEYLSQRFNLEDSLVKHFPSNIAKTKESIVNYTNDIKLLSQHPLVGEKSFSPMEISGRLYRDKEQAGKALLNACSKITSNDFTKIGGYRGFSLSLRYEAFGGGFEASLKGNMCYSTSLGKDVFGNITRINNALESMPQRLLAAQTELENLHQQAENAKEELQKPFEFEQELAVKSERLNFLDSQLNMEDSSSEIICDGEENDLEPPEDEVSEDTKPSILAALKNNVVMESKEKQLCNAALEI